MGPSLVVTALFVAAIAAALVGLNAVALRIYLRERRSVFTPGIGRWAWALTVAGAFAGPFAPALGLVGIGLASVALRRQRQAKQGAAAAPARSPIFPLPKDAWGEGGPALAARIALVNGVGITLVFAVVVAGVYFAPGLG